MEEIKGEKMPAEDVDYKSHGSDDIEARPASGGLTRALQGRHMQMIAIGTLFWPCRINATRLWSRI